MSPPPPGPPPPRAPAPSQCKHQLAARLSWILKACPVTPVDDAMIANMLLET
jgi:hypothetical protein